MSYEVRVIKAADFDDELLEFMFTSLKEVIELHDRKINPANCRILKFAEHQRLTICFKNGRPVGYMMSALTRSIFDENVKILKQISLYTRPKTRAANLLMKDFIDFGRANADHVISMIGVKTNIKPQTLERLGFKHLETLYIMEV